jgi:hypothetical protein
VLKLFEKLNFIIVVHEVRVEFSMISEVVQQMKEGLSITVQEYFSVIIFFQLHHSFEPFVEE